MSYVMRMEISYLYCPQRVCVCVLVFPCLGLDTLFCWPQRASGWLLRSCQGSRPSAGFRQSTWPIRAAGRGAESLPRQPHEWRRGATLTPGSRATIQYNLCIYIYISMCVISCERCRKWFTGFYVRLCPNIHVFGHPLPPPPLRLVQ